MIRTFTDAFVVTLLGLFPVMNPIGNLPAFAALTARDPASVRRAQAIKTGIYVAVLLSVFTLAGKPLLHALGISLPALQIAGGLIVAHAAFGMVTAAPQLRAVEAADAHAADDVSFSPMAMPLLAGPGSLGIVISLASRSSGVAPIGGILVGALVMALVVSVVLLFGDPLVNKLGPAGLGALTRIFGFLILAVGVELIVHGVLAVAPGLLAPRR